MKITKVTVKKEERDYEKVKGYASVVIDDSFAIHGIKIIQGKKGIFIAMPSRKVTAEKYIDVCHPINEKLRKEFTDAILNEFNKLGE